MVFLIKLVSFALAATSAAAETVEYACGSYKYSDVETGNSGPVPYALLCNCNIPTGLGAITGITNCQTPLGVVDVLVDQGKGGVAEYGFCNIDAGKGAFCCRLRTPRDANNADGSGGCVTATMSQKPSFTCALPRPT